MEPGLKKSLADRNHKFDSHYKVAAKQMKRKPTKGEREKATRGEITLGPLDEEGCETVKRIGVSLQVQNIE